MRVRESIIYVSAILIVFISFLSTAVSAKELSITSEEFREYFEENKEEQQAFEEFLYRSETSNAGLLRGLGLERIERIVAFGDGSHYISFMRFNGRVVFCANPYISAAYGLEYDESYDWYNLSWQTQWRIWMLVRFGYQEEATNAMYVATQTMIWEALGFYESPWMDISQERQRIEERISGRTRQVSFAQSLIDTGYMQKLTLTDTNNVLNSMEISCDEGLVCEKNGNNLHITLIDREFSHRSNNVYLSRHGNTDPSWVGIVYVKGAYQPVLSVTDWIEPGIDNYLTIRLGYGDLAIEKKNEDGVFLPGHKFQLAYDEYFLEIVDEFETNEEGNIICEGIMAGVYYLREVETTIEYELNSTIYKVDVKANTSNRQEVINKRRKLQIVIEKEEIGKDLRLNGATFQLFLVEEEEEYIDEYIAGAFFVKGKPNTLYKVFAKESELSITEPLYEFVTDSFGEIIEYISEGEYLVLDEEDNVFVYKVEKGFAYAPEFEYGSTVKLCEVKAPSGYQLIHDSCQLIEIIAEKGVNEVHVLFENPRVVIPNMGN